MLIQVLLARNLLPMFFDWGDPYYYYYEPEIGGTWAMPNGVISRWPILSSGQWNDSQLTNRSFVWAVIDIPGDIDLSRL